MRYGLQMPRGRACREQCGGGTAPGCAGPPGMHLLARPPVQQHGTKPAAGAFRPCKPACHPCPTAQAEQGHKGGPPPLPTPVRCSPMVLVLLLPSAHLSTVVAGRTKAAGLPFGFSKAHTQSLSAR